MEMNGSVPRSEYYPLPPSIRKMKMKEWEVFVACLTSRSHIDGFQECFAGFSTVTATALYFADIGN
jgi:hypothetical protein